VGGVINMCGEFPGHTVELETHGVEQLHLPTLDYHSPNEQDMLRGIEFIHRHITAGRGVYVHCKAGRGRSVTLAMCYLMAAHGLTPEQAHRRIRDVRPQIDRRVVRRSAVRAIERSLAEGTLKWTPPDPALSPSTAV
jgi:atypical dual specificity phosphatase